MVSAVKNFKRTTDGTWFWQFRMNSGPLKQRLDRGPCTLHHVVEHGAILRGPSRLARRINLPENTWTNDVVPPMLSWLEGGSLASLSNY